MTLDDLQSLLDSAVRPSDIFGADIDGTLVRLQSACHPDRWPGDSRAEALFKRLGTLAAEAKAPTVKVKSPKRTYELLRRIAVGDVSDCWLSQADKKDYLLKISRVKGGDVLLDAERQSLAKIHTEAGDSHYAAYFPLPAESFPARDKFAKRVNAYVYEPGFFTLEQVRDRHPDGLDGRHLAWIFKRLLTAIGFAHRCGIVHGAVLPSHVMLNPKNHGLRLVGWIHAAKVGQQVKTISKKCRMFYPPEVLTKKPCVAATDIHMAAKCVQWMSDSSCHLAISRFLRTCTFDCTSMRPGDAWTLLDEFDELLKGLFGAPKFHHLAMET